MPPVRNKGNDVGIPSEFVLLAGSSRDGHAHGGRSVPPPRMISQRVQVLATDHPRTDRWISLTTIQLTPTPLYRVGVVDGHGKPRDLTRDYPTEKRARTAAQNLYAAQTKENDQ